MSEQHKFTERQRILADFGDFVLDHDDLDEILTEGCRLIAAALDANLAKVIEIQRSTDTGIVRAGVGWNDGIVGHERISLSERSSEAFAIEKTEPVITNDITREERFDFPRFLLDHGVVALVNVPILLPGRKPYGILQVDAREPREFDQDDIEFLKTYAMVLGPVIDRLKTMAELRRTDERLRLIVDNAHAYVMVVSDADDRIIDWLGGSEDILGWSASEAIGNPTDVIFTDEDRATGVPARELSGAREHGAAANVRWHRRKDGSPVFLDGQTIALKDQQGKLRGYFKIGQDVTDRKRGEERQGVLVAELQHRTRNLIGVVRSMADKTARTSTDLADFRARFRDRLDALARVQGLLSRLSDLDRVTFDDLIRTELAAMGGSADRVRLDGPGGVRLRSSTVQMLAMALHELATNAVKYGALGEPDARLAVTWSLEPVGADGKPWLHIVWQESGVEMPPAGAAANGTGQGRELIEQALPYQLGARTTYTHGPEGVRCTISIPVSEMTSEAQHG